MKLMNVLCTLGAAAMLALASNTTAAAPKDTGPYAATLNHNNTKPTSFEPAWSFMDAWKIEPVALQKNADTGPDIPAPDIYYFYSLSGTIDPNVNMSTMTAWRAGPDPATAASISRHQHQHQHYMSSSALAGQHQTWPLTADRGVSAQRM